MSNLWDKVRDLFIPHSQPIEAKGVTKIQDPNCAKCHGGKCSFLLDFILFDPHFAEECCICDLHRTLELSLSSVPLPMVILPGEEEDKLVDRVDFPRGAHAYLSDGVERYQEQYYRRK